MSNDLSEADFNELLPDTQEPDAITITERCLAADGLRQMADAFERLSTAGAYIGNDTLLVHASTKDEFQKYGRALGKFTKSADENYFNLTRQFDGDMKLRVFIARSTVCKRVLIRTEEVPEQVIAAVPEKRIPASTREVYGWECTSSVLTSAPQESVAMQPQAIAQTDDIPF